jgi:hypothetical protein
MFVPDTKVSCLAATWVVLAIATELTVGEPVKFTPVVDTSIGRLLPLPSESTFGVPLMAVLSPVFISPGYVPAGVKPFNDIPMIIYYSKYR